MYRSLPTTILMILLIAGSAAMAAPRQVTWDDLVPKTEPIPDPFAYLETDQKIELGLIADVRRERDQMNLPDTDPNVVYAEELAEKLTKQGLDVDALLAKDREFMAAIAEQNRQLVVGLDGQTIKIPGYALPLEFETKAVRKFLLVPYVGACIHAPPPPPNQLVVVDLIEPYVVEDVFMPVWITGRITAKPSTEALTLVDGTANIEAGYKMTGHQIEPYEE